MLFLPTKVQIAEPDRYANREWLGFFQALARLSTWTEYTLSTQPVLRPSDAGRLIFLGDFRHLVRWTGTVWEFAPGDVGNGFYRQSPIPPQEAGWGLCDGSAYSYLVVGGATLTTANHTTSVTAGHYFRR